MLRSLEIQFAEMQESFIPCCMLKSIHWWCVLIYVFVHLHVLCACHVYLCLYLHIVLHKRIFYIRTNLRMLQHLNVKCNISMFIVLSEMMYFDDCVVLVH